MFGTVVGTHRDPEADFLRGHLSDLALTADPQAIAQLPPARRAELETLRRQVRLVRRLAGRVAPNPALDQALARLNTVAPPEAQVLPFAVSGGGRR